MEFTTLTLFLMVQLSLVLSAKHNVALNKSVMSSGEGPYSSSRATDGDTKADSHEYCIETANTTRPSWWRVDLELMWQIENIIIYFRTDYKTRRNGIQVYVTDSTQVPSGHHCYNVTGWSNHTYSDIDDVLNITCSARGRYVLLYTNVENQDIANQPVFDFCEVQVYVTPCPSGIFGPNCNQSCHCQGKTCDYTTGVCPGGVCQPGWQNQTCDTACNTVEYGQNCSKLCLARNCNDTNNGSCDHVNGTCSGGCQPGWMSTDCNEKCQRGYYGSNCTQSCTDIIYTHCSECHHVTGACDENNCVPGWTGENCTHLCTDIHPNCPTCRHVTGACDETDCFPGWTGDNCTQGVSIGKDLNIGPILGAVAAVVVVVVIVAVVVVFIYRSRRKHGRKDDGQ